ncbi:MAG TPA: L-seryl-tRNA(Sec) selenium transferase [Peptococcaceae bacterium]|nr:MAG: L-seryl-tRNA(Sec) selenium transferase [Clostridia bacterium 41_269]HBT19815.1 L-seryl-tRNA(Sec) selenium transferase [Peptococcaceae bacterium]
MYGWKQSLLRQLPKVDRIMEKPKIKKLLEEYPRDFVVETIREALNDLRTEIMSMEKPGSLLDEASIVDRVVYLVENKSRPNLRPVINATGVVLHTNLGRALLSKRAVNAVMSAARNYTNLELDLETGERGSRFSHVEELLKKLTGAEDCMVVNNNAGAVLLALNTLAEGREVVVSRGQLVEIGGSFRIPEIMKLSGAHLVEVGTTNRTYPSDYEKAVSENTALLLMVHTSNYKIIGFVRETTPLELVEVGRKRGIPVMMDLGSGCIGGLDDLGITDEPKVEDILKCGVDVVTFSGDKLLGGPQCGIIVGRKKYISPMKENPLARALRIDKMTVAALEATLREYVEGTHLDNIPTLKMIRLPLEVLRKRAEELQYKINVFTGLDSSVVEGKSPVGGGALPQWELPTYLVRLKVPGISPEQILRDLRGSDPPVIALIREDCIAFDVRTIKEEELSQVASSLARIIP